MNNKTPVVLVKVAKKTTNPKADSDQPSLRLLVEKKYRAIEVKTSNRKSELIESLRRSIPGRNANEPSNAKDNHPCTRALISLASKNKVIKVNNKFNDFK